LGGGDEGRFMVRGGKGTGQLGGVGERQKGKVCKGKEISFVKNEPWKKKEEEEKGGLEVGQLIKKQR